MTAGVQARHPDGCWWFRDGRVHSAAASFAPFALDFHQRWTFARFLPGGQLALAFESGQPWSENGSYGFRYGGVEVLSWTGVGWALVALEYDERDHAEEFVPDDVVWHPDGVLAWMRNGLLYAQRLVTPRPMSMDEPEPARDSDAPLAFSLEVAGPWRRLDLDPGGRVLMARGRGRVDAFDLQLGVQGA